MNSSEELPVRVAVRARPLVAPERIAGANTVVDIDKKSAQAIVSRDKMFAFDFAYGLECTQADIYSDMVKPLEEKVFQGYNATLLAYGQTGSGKTYTMGTTYSENILPEHVGIIPRVIKSMFGRIEEEEKSGIAKFKIRVSFLEIHNEQINDLLQLSKKMNEENFKPRSKTAINESSISIRENSKGNIVLNGLSEEEVQSAKEIYTYLEQGSLARQTASTNMNATSSRSHAIFTISIDRTSLIVEECAASGQTCGKFHLVDLAGSERIKKTKAEGLRMREGININKGLLALGNVISSLGDPAKQSAHVHIPYRDSKLTRILQDSLGGNSYTAMIACVSPADSNVDETVNTLRYAHRARNIKNKPIVNTDPTFTEISSLRRQLHQLQQDLLLSNIKRGTDSTYLSQQHQKEDLSTKMLKLKQENESLNSVIQQLRKIVSDSRDEILAISAENNRLKFAIEEGIHWDESSENKSINKSVLEEQTKTIKELTCTVERLKMEQMVTASLLRAKPPIPHETSNLFAAVDEDEDEINTELQFAKYEHVEEQTCISDQISVLDVNLKHKEDLIARISGNLTDSKLEKIKEVYNRNMKTLSTEVEKLTSEREKLLLDLETAKNNFEVGGKTNVSVGKYKSKLRTLERQLSYLKQKQAGQQKILEMKEISERKVVKLRGEVESMRREKIKLAAQKSQATERFREFKLKKKQELSSLRKEDRMRKIELEKLKVAHSQQKTVLKRKMEEVASVKARAEAQQIKRQNAELLRAQYSAAKGETGGLKATIQKYLASQRELSILQLKVEEQVEQRKNITQTINTIERTRRTNTESFGKAEEQHLAELQHSASLCSARIMQLNEEIIKNQGSEDTVSKVWSCVRSVADAKQLVRETVKISMESIKKNFRNKRDDMAAKEANLKLKSALAKVEGEKTALAFSFEKKLLEIQSEHEDHMSLIMEQISVPPAQATAGTDPMSDSEGNEHSKIQEVGKQNNSHERYTPSESFSEPESVHDSDSDYIPSPEHYECLNIRRKKKTRSQKINAPFEVFEEDPPPPPSTKLAKSMPPSPPQTEKQISMPSMSELACSMKSKPRRALQSANKFHRREERSYKELHERKATMQDKLQQKQRQQKVATLNNTSRLSKRLR